MTRKKKAVEPEPEPKPHYRAAFIVFIDHDGDVVMSTDFNSGAEVDRLATRTEMRRAAQDMLWYFQARDYAAVMAGSTPGES